MLELGTQAPDFTAATAAGETSLYAWQDDSWMVLFSYPKAFTSVCSNELVAAAKLLSAYQSADVKLATVSADSAEDQAKFGTDLETEHSCPSSQLTQFADPELRIATLYGMVHPQLNEQLTMRLTYVLDPTHRVRLLQAYPPPVERDFAALLSNVEAIRARDAPLD